MSQIRWLQRFKREMRLFLLAAQFMTRLPLSSCCTPRYTKAYLKVSARYYPLVGLLVGFIVSAILWGSSHIWPYPVAILLSMIASLLLTGAFHEDGLADTFDGIGGGQDREHTLTIMKDSRLGTYGASALILTLMLKYVLLLNMPLNCVIASLLFAHCLSRLSAVTALQTSTYVRSQGKSKPVAQKLRPWGFGFAVFSTLPAWLMLHDQTGYETLAGALAAIILSHIFGRLFYERKLRGYTGDTLGFLQQISELAIYLGILACPSI